MSILLALLFQANPAEVPLSKIEKRAASKIERKMNRWTGRASFRTTPQCITTKSSKDIKIDRLACEAHLTCIAKQNERAAEIREQVDKIGETKKSKGKAKIRSANASKDLLECIKIEKRKQSIALAKKKLEEEKE